MKEDFCAEAVLKIKMFFNFEKAFIINSGVLIRNGVYYGISEMFPLWNC